MSKLPINEIIHAPNRLKICAFLLPLEFVEFQVLRDELDVSDSVLSKHLKQLEIPGYVRQRKGSANGRKRSWVYLTNIGRKAFREYIEGLKSMIPLEDD